MCIRQRPCLHDGGDRANPKCDDYMWSLLRRLAPSMRPKRTGDRDLFAGRCGVDPRTGEYPVNHLRGITVAGFLAATVLPAAAAEISGAEPGCMAVPPRD
jgi:hypothetical protein